MQLLIVLLLLFTPASVQLNWTSPERSAIAVKVQVQDEFIERCAQSGLTVRYRYTVQVCRSRSWWFDRCSDEILFVRSLRYDPITELYHLTADRIGDGEVGSAATARTKDEAFAFVQRMDRLELAQLADDQELLGPAGQPYLTLAVSAGCKSEYSETFAKVSSILSLGMAPAGVVESGVITFPLVN